MNIRVVKKKVPLTEVVNGRLRSAIPSDMIIGEMKKQTDHMVVNKPERRLGAGWIDSLVANRQIFAVCEDCYRRYIIGERWWKTRNYLPVWSPKFMTDCDGCSGIKLCNHIVPAEAPPSNSRLNLKEGAKLCMPTSR